MQRPRVNCTGKGRYQETLSPKFKRGEKGRCLGTRNIKDRKKPPKLKGSLWSGISRERHEPSKGNNCCAKRNGGIAGDRENRSILRAEESYP